MFNKNNYDLAEKYVAGMRARVLERNVLRLFSFYSILEGGLD